MVKIFWSGIKILWRSKCRKKKLRWQEPQHLISLLASIIRSTVLCLLKLANFHIFYLCKEWLSTPYSSILSSLEQSSFSLVIWRFAALHSKFILSRDLWYKIFLIPVENLFLRFSFSVEHNRAVNWSSNTLELLPSNIAKFCIILFGRDRTNKRLWNFYLRFHYICSTTYPSFFITRVLGFTPI